MPNTTVDRAYRLLADVGGGVVAGLGLVVLVVGWWGGADEVTRLHDSLVSMKANTAAGFILLGIAAMTFRRAPAVARAAGVAMLAIGGLTWLEYAADIDLGIDQLLASDRGDEFTTTPGRMGLNSAIAFTAFGVLTLVTELDSTAEVGRIRRGVALVCSAIGLYLPLLAVYGYVFDARDTTDLGRTTQMALHTSIGFVLASVAYRDATSARGPFRLARSYRLGGRSFRVYEPLVVIVLMVSFVPFRLLQQAGRIDDTAVVLALGLTLATMGSTLLGLVFLQRLETADRALEDSRRSATAELEAKVEERTAELAAVTTELERSNTELSQFAHIASHDLREPIRMVGSFAQKLRQNNADQLDDRGMQYLGFLEEGAERMDALVRSLLDYSRAGSMLEIQDVSLDALVVEVLELLRQPIERSNARIRVDPLPLARVDPLLFRQAVQNLIANALKFVPDDERPDIHVHGRRDGDHITLIVDDSGIGIPEQFRDDVFQLFRRLHHRSDFEGSGSGLTFTRRVVERHGGRIEVEESPTGGTRVVIQLDEKQA